ncbi:MAG: CHAD domain-containing protein [Labilithrix sp.]|nr:CHAD domain-containing protein [Labilithrix sp.]
MTELLHPHAEAGPYVSKKLRELDAALALAIPRVVESADDDAIHDLRVAIRRLRTMLKMARPIYGRWHADAVRRAFADVMRATGDLRDEEVLEETLEDASASPAFGSWLHGRQAREKKLRRAVLARIEQGALDRARLMLKAMLVFPVDPKREVELARFARRTVERARRAVEKGRDVSPDDVEGLHDLRIAYKELRYSIELLAEALPLDARAMLEPSTVFQKRLGEIHDVDVAIEVVKRTRTLPDDARDEALASLAASRAKRVAKYLKEHDPLRAAAEAARANASEEVTPPEASGSGRSRPS